MSPGANTGAASVLTGRPSGRPTSSASCSYQAVSVFVRRPRIAPAEPTSGSFGQLGHALRGEPQPERSADEPPQLLSRQVPRSLLGHQATQRVIEAHRRGPRRDRGVGRDRSRAGGPGDRLGQV